MVNYDDGYGPKLEKIIAYILKKPSNDFSLEDKNLGEKLRETVEPDVKKLRVAKSLSNIEARFHVLD